jgi:gamma-glutamyltranspeptidase/glutathione hydrolase
MFRKLLALLIVAPLLTSCVTDGYNHQAAKVLSAASAHSTGVASSADPRATAAGEEMLAKGGSATDAAIAIMLALTVVEPQSSGIGGGGFYVRANSAGEVTTIDGRETAPAAAGPDWFLDDKSEPVTRGVAVQSGLSIGVPGNIALAAKAHRKYGKLEWSELFEPAIRLAEAGFVMNPRLAISLDGMIDRAGADPAMREIFYKPDGSVRDVGSLILRKELAKTLRSIADHGPAAMYGPEAAAGLADYVALVTPRDGAMSAQDIVRYEAIERDAVCGAYRKYRICGMGPPSSGGIAVLQILGMLEGYDLASLGPYSTTFWHLYLEAQELAYADRAAYIADPEFVSVPIPGLLDRNYLEQRSRLLDPAMAAPYPAAGKPFGAVEALAKGSGPDEGGTSHMVAVDAQGTMVSYTSTVEGPFGSGLQFGGYHLNNELTDFSFTPSDGDALVANRVEAGKRPRSSMAPMIIYDPDGEPFMAIGGGGGMFIPVSTTRSIIGVIDFGLSLEEALGLPLVMGFPPGIYIESGTFVADKRAELEALGHKIVRESPLPFGSVSTVAAMRTENGWITAFDPRFKDRLIAP